MRRRFHAARGGKRLGFRVAFVASLMAASSRPGITTAIVFAGSPKMRAIALEASDSHSRIARF
jgi:hypothetical protein